MAEMDSAQKIVVTDNKIRDLIVLARAHFNQGEFILSAQCFNRVSDLLVALGHEIHPLEEAN